jgi:hypothetical protein
VGAYCEVASLKHHVADLAFSKILKHAVIASPISVAVFKPFLAGDNNHERALRWGDNATLLLAAEFDVDVRSAIIDFSFLEAPAHAVPVLGFEISKLA